MVQINIRYLSFLIWEAVVVIVPAADGQEERRELTHCLLLAMLGIQCN